MRLVISLLLASLSATVTVLLIYAWISVDAHRQSWLDDMKEDHHAIVGMLTEALEAVAERHGIQYAHDLVEDVNERKDNVHLEWIPAASGSGGGAQRGVTHRSIAEDGDGSEPSLETRADVFIAGEPAGTLLLVESTAISEQFVASRIRRLTITGFLMLVCGTTVGAGAGFFLVARRVRAMVSQARRVAAGELDQRIENLGPDDELGELGRELNAMTGRLAETRVALDEQNQARLRALDELRHGERLMTIGKLAAGIAHELGTPLNVVTVSAKMIADGEATGAEVPEYAQIIADQGARMSKIIGELMTFARRRAPERVDVDLELVARSTCALLAPLADRHEVVLRVTGSEPTRARVDPGQIQQVLTNLVANAIFASRAGDEVVIEVASESPVEPASGDGGCATISVRDHGEGIAPEHLDRIFEPFFTTKDVGAGAGLGLSVAYGLVVEHGGRIEVDSERGVGSTFRVLLPTDGGQGAATGARVPT